MCEEPKRTSDSVGLETLKATMDMYQAQYSATDKLWAYFGTVTLAYAAYAASGEIESNFFLGHLAVSGGYLVFCIGNGMALAYSHRQLYSLAELVWKHGEQKGLGRSKFPLATVTQVSGFHGFLTLLNLCMVVGLAWLRSQS